MGQSAPIMVTAHEKAPRRRTRPAEAGGRRRTLPVSRVSDDALEGHLPVADAGHVGHLRADTTWPGHQPRPLQCAIQLRQRHGRPGTPRSMTPPARADDFAGRDSRLAVRQVASEAGAVEPSSSTPSLSTRSLTARCRAVAVNHSLAGRLLGPVPIRAARVSKRFRNGTTSCSRRPRPISAPSAWVRNGAGDGCYTLSYGEIPCDSSPFKEKLTPSRAC